MRFCGHRAECRRALVTLKRLRREALRDARVTETRVGLEILAIAGDRGSVRMALDVK